MSEAQVSVSTPGIRQWSTPELVELSVAATEVGVTSVNQDLSNPATETGSINLFNPQS